MKYKHGALCALALFVTGCTEESQLAVKDIVTKSNKSAEFIVGTGTKAGAYNAFGQSLKGLSTANLKIDLVNTGGSLDNLNRIKNQESEERLDAAIVQNDVAYKVYSGRNDKHEINNSFRSGLPLFREMLFLIVLNDSDVFSMSDLKRRSVWVGDRVSGTRKNATRVIEEMALRGEIIMPVSKVCEFPQCLETGEFDAVFYTSASLPKWFDDSFRLVGMPAEIVNKIVEETPYYHKASLPSDLGDKVTLSVLAYLFIGKHVKTKDAELLVDAITDRYDELKSSDQTYTLLNLKDNIAYLPVPRHSGAERSLVKNGHIADVGISWWLVLLVIASIGLLIYSHKHAIAYDMLGCRKKEKNIFGWILKKINDFYIHVIIIIVALSVFSVSLWSVRQFENSYAIENNTRSSLYDISFSQALVWMFVFTGSGETDGKFPKSTLGKVLVSIFPLIGYTSLIGLAWASYYQRRKTKIEISRGNLITPQTGHVLICGWNEKAPGIIYGLTCKDAPAKRKVVVVAELGSDAPLAKYNFDHRLVFYCNGDSANTDVLLKAHVRDADDAIILAGTKKRHSKNIRSILTALALKSDFSIEEEEAGKLQKYLNYLISLPKRSIQFFFKNEIKFIDNTSLFVITELLYKENKKRFDAVNTDAILDSEVFSNRLVSSSCLGGNIVSFVMDILSHDDFSEIYIVKAETLNKEQDNVFSFGKYLNRRPTYTWAGWSLGLLRQHLMKYGVNLIGLKHTAKGETGWSDIGGFTFDDQESIKLVFKNPEYIILADDKLFFLAEDQQTFTNITSGKRGDESSREQVVPIQIEAEVNYPIRKADSIFTPSAINILIIGSWVRCKSIQEEFVTVNYVHVSILSFDAPNSEIDNTRVYNYDPEVVETWDKIPIEQFDRIVILAQDLSDLANNNLLDDKGELDAPTLFVASNLKKYIDRRSLNSSKDYKKIRILAEMLNYRYRYLFDSSVDVVIPTTMFIERLLIKGIYHHGEIGNFLTALLAERDGIYLLSYCVRNNDYFVGLTIETLFAHASKGIQVLGYHPLSHADAFKKKGADFKVHFAVSPFDLENIVKQHKKSKDMEPLNCQSKVQPGDTVVMIYSSLSDISIEKE